MQGYHQHVLCLEIEVAPNKLCIVTETAWLLFLNKQAKENKKLQATNTKEEQTLCLIFLLKTLSASLELVHFSLKKSAKKHFHLCADGCMH